MKTILCLLLVTISSFAYSISPSDISKMVNQFHAQNLLNKEQTHEVLNKLNQITPDQWKQIRNIASQTQIKNGNKKVNNTLQDASSLIDTKSPEFKKLSTDLRKALGK